MTESSLRSGLTVRFLCAALALLVLDAVACYVIAAHFANLVYDRWLIDSDRSLAQALSVSGGRIELDLPSVALKIFQYDEVDHTYYRVSTDRRGLIGGDPALPPVQPGSDAEVRLVTSQLARQPVRIVATRITMPRANDTATVEVAETLHKRGTLMREILLAMAAPQLALLLAAFAFSSLAVGHGLRPLTALAAEIEARGQDNLAPVPELHLPREARGLVSKINDLLARLERSLTLQRRFLTDAAHQLRTPLAAVLLYAERAERAERARDPQAERQALHELHTAVARAARLSQQLLSLARTEPEAAAARQLTRLDLTALARSVGEEWIPRALARQIDFGFQAPLEPVFITGNAGMLAELLSNLIDNALRYCEPHSRVTVCVEPGPAPALVVEDDGPGIPPEEREKIFDRFYRLGHEPAEGCGLGLAIVREIARAHRAEAQVTSGRLGHGARFRVTFPARLSEAA